MYESMRHLLWTGSTGEGCGKVIPQSGTVMVLELGALSPNDGWDTGLTSPIPEMVAPNP